MDVVLSRMPGYYFEFNVVEMEYDSHYVVMCVDEKKYVQT